MPAHRFHFLTGLPRSGSTLLAAILRQNPAIAAGMSSPVGQITSALRVMMTQNREIKTLIDDGGRRRILRGIFDGYYSDQTQRKIVIDTNRGWSGRIPELLDLFPDVRLIATVRDPAWIFDSAELITRQAPLRQSGMIKPGSNIDRRAETMISADGFIGGPLGHLKEAVFGPDASRLMLIDYQAFCLNPKLALDSIYRFLGEDPYPHTFDYVSYEQEAFDEALNTPGLHTVSGPVQFTKRKTILPPEIFGRLSAMAFWKDNLPDNVARVMIDRANVKGGRA